MSTDVIAPPEVHKGTIRNADGSGRGVYTLIPVPGTERIKDSLTRRVWVCKYELLDGSNAFTGNFWHWDHHPIERLLADFFYDIANSVVEHFNNDN